MATQCSGWRWFSDLAFFQWIRVVKPEDIDVLGISSQPVLTLVTCYPFYYTGPAPERFIVRARQVRFQQTSTAPAPYGNGS